MYVVPIYDISEMRPCLFECHGPFYTITGSVEYRDKFNDSRIGFGTYMVEARDPIELVRAP